jgi:hypothetical protein
VDGLYVPNEGLLWVTAGAIVAWLAVVAFVWVVRFPRRPRAGKETTDLGPETPALANLVTHRFEPTPDAVPATLVDLAARGVVEIEDRGIGRYFCRVGEHPGTLTPYETMLFDHLRRVASGGVVPAEALTTGPQDRSRGWWKQFRNEVVVDAQARGLSLDLWDKWAKGVLFVGAAVVFLLFETAIGFNDPEEVAPSTLKDVVLMAGAAAFAVVLRAATSKRQRSTDAGDRAAARWLGVRRALEESPSFELLPPSGVVVWERHLAYAAALGVAPRSVRALPMGAESDTEAWTASSGEWRKVEVRYPRFRPGWGRHPLLAVAVGAAGTFVARWLFRLGTGDLGGDATWLNVTAGVALALAVLVALRSVPQLLLGILDLFGTRAVEGTVLRARARWGPFPYFHQTNEREYVRFFVAIDDGRSSRIAAYRVGPKVYDVLPQGGRAKLTVTPNLGYVRRPSE